jgi:hypothetical protein
LKTIEKPSAEGSLKLRNVVNVDEARALVQKISNEALPSWSVNRWLLGDLDESDFRNLLIYFNGPNYNGWQKLTPTHSSKISDIAPAILDYSGQDQGLIGIKHDIHNYPNFIETKGPWTTYCLVRVGTNGKMTLFNTNRRVVALYLYHFVLMKSNNFPKVQALIAEVPSKVFLQSE